MEGPTAPFLVPFNSSVNVVIRNKSSNPSAQAWLELTHSGSEWLSVPLGDDKAPVETALDLRIQGLIIVDTVTGRDIDAVYHCDGCITSDREMSIRAECNQQAHVDRVVMTLTYATGVRRHTETTPPFTLFGDNSGQYVGRTLPPGLYTVTAQAIGVNGETGPLKTEIFIVFE